MIENLIHFENVKIEIIGEWIWLSGNTREYKERIKELGFRWSQNKVAWYFHEGTYKKRSKNNFSLNELREKFGTHEVENELQYKLA